MTEVILFQRVLSKWRLVTRLLGLGLIAVSGYGEEQARHHSEKAGFNHYLVKPVNFDALLAVLNR